MSAAIAIPPSPELPAFWLPIPRLWPGETVVIAACGPSLTKEDLEFCRGKARVIVINDAYRLAPWADLLHASDRQWWRLHWPAGTGRFVGLKTGCEMHSRTAGDYGAPVLVLRGVGHEGLEIDPARGIRTGSNSGHQAINLAYHLSGGPIVLLGFDMQATGGRTHWHGDHGRQLRNPKQSDFDRWGSAMKRLAAELRAAGVPVRNCSRETALTCFPRARLEDISWLRTPIPAI